ncbi:hypothetical protein CLH39_11775 [Alcaligenes faecalis]|uniref:hypothetical protein n=1 Tax=Alcaligenes faecalis TaxID=511 RepID=UPI00193325B2|nr:hypothetical protein [Alcaligenes faecalis]QRF90867.1 hypothetical protein CLH39_11775 [Alcaligenes faecalis]
MAAIYKNIVFGTPLVAQWAAFFDLAGWEWSTNTIPINNWKPDFSVKFSCPHSECNGSHTILVSVLPADSLAELKGHPALTHRYIVNAEDTWVADAGALFGSTPRITQWDMSHGAGGGIETVSNWINGDMNQLWSLAEELVRKN